MTDKRQDQCERAQLRAIKKIQKAKELLRDAAQLMEHNDHAVAPPHCCASKVVEVITSLDFMLR